MIHVVLYEPEIPGNTGNIMRTCAGTNVKLHLIKPLGFSLDDKYIKRSSVNYLEYCDYTVYENYDDFLSKNKGTFYYMTRYGRKPHTSCDFSDVSDNIYLVFGKESTGIPKSILSLDLDHCFRLPMVYNARSLNLSNCVAICVYEVLRQLDYPGLSKHECIKGEDWLEK